MRVSRFERRVTTPEQLFELVRYERDEGALYWLPRPRSMFKTDGAFKTWNTRYANRRCGGLNTLGYRVSKCNHNEYFLEHRVIWFLETGIWPDTIDHIDGDVSNSRFHNLRDVTQTTNTRNAAVSKNSPTGITGIRRKHNHWYARIMVDRKDIHLYSGDSLDDAIKARKDAEARYGFHPNHGRPTIAPSH